MAPTTATANSTAEVVGRLGNLLGEPTQALLTTSTATTQAMAEDTHEVAAAAAAEPFGHQRVLEHIKQPVRL